MASEKSQKSQGDTPTEGQGLQGDRGEVTTEALVSPLVASPTGPVPMSAITNDPERAAELREEREETLERERTHPRAMDLLDEETVQALDANTLRTVALQRGYKLQGRRITAEAFLRQQNDDENLRAPEEESQPRKSARKSGKKD